MDQGRIRFRGANRWQSRVLALVVGVSSVAGAQQAAAAPMVLSQTKSFNVELAWEFPGHVATKELSETLTFDLFDPALGMLMGVAMELEGSGYLGTFELFHAKNPSNNTSLHYDLTSSMSLLAPGYVSPTPFLAASDTAFLTCLPLAEPCTDFDFYAGGTDQVVPLAAVAAFLGLGTFDVQALVSKQFAANGVTPDSRLSLLNWTGDLTLTYRYESIPEPASLVLLLTGAAAVAVRHRRRTGRPVA